MDDSQIERAVAIGEKNKEVLDLAQNWCAHLRVEIRGGVGLLEQMTRLPIGMRAITCPHARGAGFAAMDLEAVALDFYERNCVGCAERMPVRLPNLLELVDRRNQDRERHNAAVEEAREAEASALAERQRRRRLLRDGSDEARLSIYDLIERFDQNPTIDDKRVLTQVAVAAGGKFDQPLQEALFDLAASGGWIKVETALEVLARVGADRSRLGGMALEALARWHAGDKVASIVAESLLPEHRGFVPGALLAVISIAAPTRMSLIGGAGHPGDPAALLAIHRLFPDLVYEALRSVLASPSKDDRIDACEAIQHVATTDPEIGLKLAPELIESLSLPDDMYERGPAANGVARVLAMTMRLMPRETDAVIAHAMSSAAEDLASALLGIYVEVLRPEFGNAPRQATGADAIAFGRIVQSLLERRADERLSEAAAFLQDRAEYFPRLVTAEAGTLLGAAALIADDLKDRYSPLLDPRPTAERALEAQTRQLRLNSALNAIVGALGIAMRHEPEAVVPQVLQALSGLGSSHPTLRARLITTFGALRRNPEAITRVLPVLYSSMTDPHQEVRAAGAIVYGKVTDDLPPEDLPALLHETFLTLLRDPYVVVHSCAVRALHTDSIPSGLHVTASRLVTAVLVASMRGNEDGRFLSDCIEKLLSLASATGNLTPSLLEAIITGLGQLPTATAAEVLHGAWGIRRARNFADLLLHVLEDEQLDDHDVESLTDALCRLPDEELRSRSALLRDVAVRRSGHSPHHIIDLIEALMRCGAWLEAVDVARALVETVSETMADKPRKLRLRALLTAAEVEAASAGSDMEALTAAVETWARLTAEIRRDDEENAEARRPLRGLRLPNQDD